MNQPKRVETIVVGAGAAGSVIAARITEDGARQVLLLEAGPDYPDPSELPRDLGDGRTNSMRRHDWRLTHRPTSQAMMRFPYPRGRVVGGSSAVNTCIALRGMPEDYDAWAARGLKEWSWAHCLPAFKSLETDHDIQNEWHGDRGPLPIRRHPTDELTPWQCAFLEACERVGYPAAPDSNDPTQAGYGPHAMNRIDGRRISAAEAWLTPKVRAREGLEIQPDTLVRRVLFEGRRAVGVEVMRGRQVEVYEAERIVLCAGAIHTPGILLRSGVGPKDQVEALGVSLVADNPAIGARLLDHPGFAFFLLPRWGKSHRQAPLIQTVCRYTSDGSPQPNDMLLQPGNLVPFPRFKLPLVSLMGSVGKPRGVGALRWTSPNPKKRPTIALDLLAHDADRARAVDAMSRAFALVETPPMRALVRHLWPRRKILSDPARIDEWIRRSCDSGYHPSGTVPMGADDDPDAATDGRGAVRGVEGLIVADASLMPTIPSSNTHLPTLMIGERFGTWLRAAP